MNLDVALTITSTAFKNRVDKAGKPYLLHCLRVMNNLNTKDEELQCIAVLHDLIEDTSYKFPDLRDLGFSERVISGVRWLTHLKGKTYDEYILDLTINLDAIKVKIADLKDNMDLTRLENLTDKDIERLKKYHYWYNYLIKQL